MAIPTSATRPLKLPSERTIAFAISIVNSKPPELEIEEYIQLLRLHVAKGRRENALSSVYHHLDRSSYWRSRYEETKAELLSAQGENAELKQEVDSLQERLDSFIRSPVKKRKRQDEDVILVARSPKKPKQDASPAKRDITTVEGDGGFNFAGAGEIENVLMRSLYQANAQLRSGHKIEPRTMAYEVIRAAAALPQVVSKAIQPDSSGRIDPEVLRSCLIVAGRAFQTFITAFNKLSHVSDGPEAQGHITYALVEMYSKLIDSIDDIASTVVRQPISFTAQQAPSSRGKAKPSKTPTVKDCPLLDLATKFLCSLIDNLDSTAQSHNEIFEGFSYVALRNLGLKLYSIIFGYSREGKVEDQMMASTKPDGIEDFDLPVPDDTTKHKLEVVKRQTPYLIHLLKHIINAAPAHLEGPVKSTKAKQVKKGPVKGALTIAAKEKLQRTLVNCIFGTNDADENDPFKDSLRMPTISGPALPIPKLKNVKVEDWFTEEMWRLLGWEILSREGDW